MMAASVLGCVGGSDLAHYVALSERLQIPSDWDLVQTQLKDPAGADPCSRSFPSCPSVLRWYLVDGSPGEIYPTARQLLLDAGLEVRQEVSPACDAPPDAAACQLVSGIDKDAVRVSLFNPGEDVAGLGIGDPARSLVLVVAEGE